MDKQFLDEPGKIINGKLMFVETFEQENTKRCEVTKPRFHVVSSITQKT